MYSYTKQKSYDIVVDRKYILPEDRVLIIDDFLANGEALKGLIDLCDQAGSQVVGVGIGIEKAFQPGGKNFREKGYKVHSVARIQGFSGNKVTFCPKDE